MINARQLATLIWNELERDCWGDIEPFLIETVADGAVEELKREGDDNATGAEDMQELLERVAAKINENMTWSFVVLAPMFEGRDETVIIGFSHTLEGAERIKELYHTDYQPSVDANIFNANDWASGEVTESFSIFDLHRPIGPGGPKKGKGG